MAYKYDDNLKALSAPGENYKSQWLVELYTHNTSASATDLCICQRKIKHCFIVRNEINGNMVKMGTTCVKDILVQDVKNDANTRKRMKNHIIYMFEKGVYIEIHDLHDYVIKVIIDYMSTITKIEEFNRLLITYRANPIILPLLQKLYDTKHLEIERQQKIDEERRQYQLARDNEERIRILKLEEQHRLKEAELLRIKEEKRLKEVEQKRLNEEKKQKEMEEKRLLEEKNREIQRINQELYIQRMKKYQAEEEERQKIYIEQRRIKDEINREKNEFQKQYQENNTKVCECGLKCINECSCDNPKWVTDRLTTQIRCTKCDSWKCRL